MKIRISYKLLILELHLILLLTQGWLHLIYIWILTWTCSKCTCLALWCRFTAIWSDSSWWWVLTCSTPFLTTTTTCYRAMWPTRPFWATSIYCYVVRNKLIIDTRIEILYLRQTCVSSTKDSLVTLESKNVKNQKANTVRNWRILRTKNSQTFCQIQLR